MVAEPAVQVATVRSTLPSDGEFIRLSSHLKKLCGINLPLSEKNLALMSSRLQKLRGKYQLTYRSLIEALDRGDKRAANLFVVSMTTNTTHFFREAQHFEILKQFVAERFKSPQGQREIRIWCAASSTGEEPYGIAMCVDDQIRGQSLTLKMLATDIDCRVLDVAKNGRYSERLMENVPPTYLERYFERLESVDDVYYQAKESIRSMIHFGRLNLLLSYPFKGHFDAIFCRNVLIYFDKETVSQVIQRMTKALYPGGYLFLGHSEAIAGMSPGLTRVGPAVYKKVG